MITAIYLVHWLAFILVFASTIRYLALLSCIVAAINGGHRFEHHITKGHEILLAVLWAIFFMTSQ